ncbi:hypothetical protein CFR74_10940 [Novacetimonas hansenii]|nr:hypothetical protein CFR74_10940 [Novacetimonas hansenii]
MCIANDINTGQLPAINVQISFKRNMVTTNIEPYAVWLHGIKFCLIDDFRSRRWLIGGRTGIVKFHMSFTKIFHLHGFKEM